MKKKVYLIQPTYRKMDGKPLKGWNFFHHSINLAILSALVPDDWAKDTCVEYFNDIDYNTDASVIGITNMAYDIRHAFDIASAFKRKDKIVIFCGIQDKFSEKALGEICDGCFYGFPSKSEFAELLDAIQNSKLKQAYHFGLHINFPFDYEVLRHRKMRYVPLISSIGCVNVCEYCCHAVYFKGRFRLRKIEYVLSDLRSISEWIKYGVFLDSNFYNNRHYVLQLCKEIIQQKIKVTWGAQLTIDVTDDDEVLYYLKKAGCRTLIFGLETVDQANLDYMDKHYQVEQYLRQLLKARAAGLYVVGNFMVGLDNDTVHTFDYLYTLICKSKISLPLVNILLPVPGTPLFNRLKEEGRLFIRNEQVFMEKNPVYSVPCNKCYFDPAKMTGYELEYNFMKLYHKLTRFRNILSRSLVRSPRMIPNLFYVNLKLRQEYYAMAKHN